MAESEWTHWTLEAMEIYGGGFVQALRRAYIAADQENQRRIREAWPEYGKQYRLMGEGLADRTPPLGS